MIDPDQIQIGHWFTLCCELDLRQITPEDDLEELRMQMREYGAQAWETQEAALLDLRNDGDRIDD